MYRNVTLITTTLMMQSVPYAANTLLWRAIKSKTLRIINIFSLIQLDVKTLRNYIFLLSILVISLALVHYKSINTYKKKFSTFFEKYCSYKINDFNTWVVETWCRETIIFINVNIRNIRKISENLI